MSGPEKADKDVVGADVVAEVEGAVVSDSVVVVVVELLFLEQAANDASIHTASIMVRNFFTGVTSV